ncbi:MAG: hypothetical protein TQ35_0006805 [Candidatus Aramenus sulfurataquae]|jgi:hypothetical protein|uniref:Uncharacterized protein n=3 Tax=Candidatus Aramenus sulfurataquae TaxID=1326980 RepID=A0AAE3FLZ1_9CREN|nr:hypothetical protein [Candidatus Aramenus sulfurataquae]
MSKLLLVSLFLIPLLLAPLAFSQTGSSYSYLEYKVVYVSQTHSKDYNATATLAETLLINSTLTSSGKYLNEIKVVGTKEVNASGMFSYSASHSVNYTLEYYSNESLVSSIEKFNLTQLLNFTKAFTGNFTSSFLNVTYHVNYRPVGLVMISFNGNTYLGHEYELTKTYTSKLNASFLGANLVASSEGHQEAIAKTFVTGILYSLTSNSTKTTTTTYSFMGMTKTRTVVSTSTMSMTLVSTNVSLDDPGYEAMFLLAHTFTRLIYIFVL